MEEKIVLGSQKWTFACLPAGLHLCSVGTPGDDQFQLKDDEYSLSSDRILGLKSRLLS